MSAVDSDLYVRLEYSLKFFDEIAPGFSLYRNIKIKTLRAPAVAFAK